MRNMAVLHSPAFSYPLPVLVRVLFNLLIFKGKILYYNKYKEKSNNFHLYSIFIFRGRYFSKKHYFQEHPLFFRGISSKNI